LQSLFFIIIVFLDASDITQVEDTMGTLTERWLLIEELIEKKKSVPQNEDGNISSAVEDCEKNIDSVIESESSFSSLEANNEVKLAQLKVNSNNKNLYFLNCYSNRFFNLTIDCIANGHGMCSQDF